MKYDLLIHNGMVVTMNPGREILINGIIGVRGGRIEWVEVESSTSEKSLPEASEVIS